MNDGTGLENEVRRLLDKQALMECKHSYLRAADVCDPDRMVAGFADDFVASYVPGAPPTTTRSEIHAWYTQRLTTVVASSHHISNFEFEFDGQDRATTHSYLYSWQRFADHPTTADRHRFGRYTDTWERREDAWVQTSLTYRIAGELCNDAVPRVGEHIAWDLEALG